MSENSHKEIARLFRTLANPARLAILEALREGEHCVCHLEAYLGYRQAFISQHLALLKKVGVVEDRRDGWNIYYRVTSPQVFGLVDTARQALNLPADFWLKASAPVNCPCPQCTGAVNQATG